MERRVIVSEEAVSNLKCALCEKYLSVGPVLVMTKDGSRSKCGRCKDIPTSVNIRNFDFENVAVFIKFPCTYRYCIEYIPWGQVKSHETNCKYRTIACPMWRSCENAIEISKIQLHFNEEHKSNLYFDKVVASIPTNSNGKYLLVVKDLKFLVYIRFGALRINVGMFSLNTCDHKFNVKLTSFENDDGPSIMYRNKTIIRYDESEHCSKCVDMTCLSKWHKYCLKYGQTEKVWNTFVIDIDGKDVKNILQPVTMIKFVVTLSNEKQCYTSHIPIKAPNTSPVKAVEKFNPTTKFDNLFRQSLECPICRDYMTTPIYTCQTGHVVCHICKPLLANCPTCRQALAGSRNFSLEDISKNIELPCMNKENGCFFHDNIESLRQHEATCSYRNWQNSSSKPFYKQLLWFVAFTFYHVFGLFFGAAILALIINTTDFKSDD